MFVHLCSSPAQPADFGALMTRMMPMVTQMMPGVSAASGPAAGLAAARSPGRVTSDERPADVLVNNDMELEQELSCELGNDQAAGEWARTILGDRHQLADADEVAHEPHSAVYRAGMTRPGSSGSSL